MPTKYSTIIGPATNDCVTGSIVGVNIAENKKERTIIARHFCNKTFAVTTFIFANPITNNGVSKTNPNINKILVTKFI